jgi:peptidoglycan hydrolase CwlO-like protein
MQLLIVWGGVVGSIFGIITSAIAIAALYRSSVRKGYAAERDFNHLQRNYETLTKNIDFMAKEIDADFGTIAKEMDNRFDRIDQNQLEIKALLLSNLGIKPKSLEP